MTLLCNSSSSVLVLNRTSLSLRHTYVVGLLHLNFPLPFNIPVILTYTNTSRVNAFGRLFFIYILQYIELLSTHSWGYDQTAARLILQGGVSLSWLSSASFCLQCVTVLRYVLCEITGEWQNHSFVSSNKSPKYWINRCKQQKMNSE